MAFTLTSPAFADSAPVPAQFTCEGRDVPPLQVTEPPDRTASYAVIMDDPDAPRGTFTHWLAYDIPLGGPDLDRIPLYDCDARLRHRLPVAPALTAATGHDDGLPCGSIPPS
jgi:Phosphatidylethanolamine-binding protein